MIYTIDLYTDIMELKLPHKKVLQVGYFWPTLFKDSHAYAHKCKVYQTTTRRENRPTIPLLSVTINKPFQ